MWENKANLEIKLYFYLITLITMFRKIQYNIGDKCNHLCQKSISFKRHKLHD